MAIVKTIIVDTNANKLHRIKEYYTSKGYKLISKYTLKDGTIRLQFR